MIDDDGRLTDAEAIEEMKAQVGRCYACSVLYGHHHYVNLFDADEHEAGVAVAYLADPVAAEARIAESFIAPLGAVAPPREFLEAGPDKCAAAEKFAARSRRAAEDNNVVDLYERARRTADDNGNN